MHTKECLYIEQGCCWYGLDCNYQIDVPHDVTICGCITQRETSSSLSNLKSNNMDKELLDEVFKLLKECEWGMFIRTPEASQLRRDALDYAIAKDWISPIGKKAFDLTSEGFDVMKEHFEIEEIDTRSKIRKFIDKIFRRDV